VAKGIRVLQHCEAVFHPASSIASVLEGWGGQRVNRMWVMLLVACCLLTCLAGGVVCRFMFRADVPGIFHEGWIMACHPPLQPDAASRRRKGEPLSLRLKGKGHSHKTLLRGEHMRLIVVDASAGGRAGSVDLGACSLRGLRGHHLLETTVMFMHRNVLLVKECICGCHKMV